MKKCSRCLLQKEFKDFHRDKSIKCGLSIYCITCERERAREHYHKHRDRILYKQKHKRISNGSKPNAGFYKSKDGYVTIQKRGHPNSSKKGSILEHVFVMSSFLGRPLRKGENVHHKNGIRDDNRIENLELWSKAQPSGQRIVDKFEFCKDFLQKHKHDYKLLRNFEGKKYKISQIDFFGRDFKNTRSHLSIKEAIA